MSITVLYNQHMDQLQFVVAVLTTWLMNYSDCKKKGKHQTTLVMVIILEIRPDSTWY